MHVYIKIQHHMDDPKGFSTISMTTADVLRAVIITAACEQKVMSNEKFDSVVLLKWNVHITLF